MRFLFGALAVALCFWYQEQPDIAIYPVFLFAGMGMRAMCIALEERRRR